MSASDKIAKHKSMSEREDQTDFSPKRYGVELRSKPSGNGLSGNTKLRNSDSHTTQTFNAKADTLTTIISTSELLNRLGHRHGAAEAIKKIAHENPTLYIGPKPNTNGRERLYDISMLDAALKYIEKFTPPDGWIPKKHIPKLANMWYRSAMSMLAEIARDSPELSPKHCKAPKLRKNRELL